MKTNAEWLNKREAAALIGILDRRVLQLADKGILESKRERDPVTKQMTVYVLRSSVEKHIQDSKPVRMEVQNVAHAAMPAASSTWGGNDPMGVIVAHLAKQLHPRSGGWLTLDAAAQECGLTRALLLKLVRGGVLPALQDEPFRREGEERARSGSSWRVCRRDLDALQGGVQNEQETVQGQPKVGAARA